jgi:hypothetical protein
MENQKILEILTKQKLQTELKEREEMIPLEKI